MFGFYLARSDLQGTHQCQRGRTFTDSKRSRFDNLLVPCTTLLVELRHLRYFATVGELLNFTKAAQRLRVAQIADEPLVAYSRIEYPEYHAMLKELFASTGSAPRIAEEHDSAPNLIAAAGIGRGFIIGPACLGMLAGARLKFRPLSPAPPPVQLGALFDPSRLTGAAAKFLAAVKAASPRDKKLR